MLPTCPTLALVGLASVCAAVTEVKKFCAIPKLRDTDVTPLIAVGCTAATLSTADDAVDRLDYIVVSVSSDNTAQNIQAVMTQAYS